jgi:threonine synthase
VADKPFYYVKCIGCGEEYSPEKIVYTCAICDDILSVEYRYQETPSNLDKKWSKRPLSVWRYRELLPITDQSKIVTMGEGGTKLHKCQRLAEMLDLKELYAKNEGENPTGSFKDRGMTVGVTKALELGAKIVACASTGNTSASLAAYAAKAGIKCLILIPSGKVAFGKLAQAIVHGADVIQVRGNFDDALRIIMELCTDHSIYLLNSVNPYRIEGQKTIAFEIVDQLGFIPDKVVVPVGNAGNISAIWKGFTELHKLGMIQNLPQMIGIQAEGAAPIATAIKAGKDFIEPIAKPETLATAIRIGAPVSWKKALRAIKDSKGFAETVSDREIIEAQRLLASQEGLFVEPASAASIAGLKKLVAAGKISADEKIVCITTGHGLKDPQVIMEKYPKPIEVDADLKSIEKLLGLKTVSQTPMAVA